jgi:hypothetical protein
MEINELIRQYSRSGGYNDLAFRRTRSDDIRFAVWEGQDEDGKKHQENNSKDEVFPWDGASDTRVRLADAVINESADILTTAFTRGILRASPTEVSDAAQAEVVTTLLRYYRDNKLRNELRQEAGLLASYGLQYGFAALHVRWDREVTKKMMPITMDDLVAIAQQAGDESALGQLPAMIANPDQVELAAEVLEAELGLKRRRAKKMVRELREDGATEMPTDVVTKNCPQVVALKPFDDLFFPPETVELQSASHVFRRVWMSEFEMRELVSVYGYNEDWVEAVLNAQEGHPPNYQDPLSDLYTQTGDIEGLHEIVYAYTKQVDPTDGVLSVHCTVFNPKITELVGKETVLDHMAGQYPFVVYRRENVARKLVDTRGVPDIVHTWQNEIKGQRDMLYDRASLMVFPPLTVPARMGQVYRLQPGSELPEMRPGEVKFLDPPKSNPNEALNVIAYVEKQCDEYFGRLNDNTNPVIAQAKMQSMVDAYMTAWSEAFTMMFRLVQEYLGDEELQRIAGMSPDLPSSQGEIQGAYDFAVKFDVRELDSEYVIAKMKAIIDLLPIDTAGTVDRAKLMSIAVSMVDPILGQSVLSDQRGAAQKTFDKVNQDVALMALGNEAAYTENDPTAAMKMQFMQQIVQNNPKYQEALQGDERFQALLDNYGKNLQQSVAQEQNKMVGRLGVQPMNQQ